MKVPFNNMTPLINDLDDAYSSSFHRVLDSKHFAAGKEVRAFEDEFSDYTGAGFFRGCANGTDALELIFRALEIGPGDEVIVPSFTCWATVEPLLMVGAVPRIVDVDPDNFGIDPNLLQSVIDHHTRAVLVAHLFGCSADITAISKICELNGLLLIEDCAQAHGRQVNGKHLGNYGKAGAFSFYPTKNLGALGEAGGIVTNDIVIAEKIRMMIDHGQRKKDHHDLPGRNSRMDELQAAFLRIGLIKLPEVVDKKRDIAEQYRNSLDNVVNIPVFEEGNTYHQVVILTDRRDELKEYLSSRGIGTAIHYPYTISGILGRRESFPVADRLSTGILSLPSWYGMSIDEVDYVCKAISDFF